MRILKNIYNLILPAFLSFFITFIGIFYIHTLSPNFPDTDPYYHIKLAALIKEKGILHSFPWTQFSLWKDSYFDKDFLFHILLIPFVSDDLVASAKVATSIFAGFIGLVFYFVLRNTNVRYPFLGFILLLASSAHYWERICLLRSYSISIICLLLGLIAIFRNVPSLLFAISAIYVLSYNAAFLLPFVAVLFVLVQYVLKEKANWKIPLYSIAGFLFGAILHPNRSAMYENLILQNFSVVWTAWFSSNQLPMAVELGSLSAREFITGHIFLVICFVAIIIGNVLFGLSRSTISVTLLLLNTAFLFLAAFSQRFIEYWAPFCIWSFCLEFFSRPYKETEAPFVSKGWLRRVLVIIVIFIPALFSINLIFSKLTSNYKRIAQPIPMQAALWMRENIPKNAQVFTCDWDDTAFLFHFNEKNRYMVMADPLYMANWRYDLYKKWREITQGKDEEYYSTIKDTFKAEYVYCSSEFSVFLNKVIRDTRFERVYADSVASVFRVTQEKILNSKN
jgi:hypothetical protein